jgi:hypothetical protein
MLEFSHTHKIRRVIELQKQEMVELKFSFLETHLFWIKVKNKILN